MPDPPAYLSERAREQWRAVVPRRALSPARLALVEAALQAFDPAQLAREVLVREGMVATAREGGMPHVHPLIRVERDALALFVRAWGDLGLRWDSSIDGRGRL